MVDTCRWPNASLSVASIMPRRDAEARRGVAVDDERGLQALVLLVGVDVGQLAAAAASACADPRLPGAQLGEVVGLQRELVLRVACRPPMRMSCTGCRNRLAPGSRASLPRSRAITWSAEILRSRSGLSATNMKPGVALAAAGEADDVLHRRIRAARSRRSRRASPASPGTRCSGRPGCRRSAGRCPAAGRSPWER